MAATLQTILAEIKKNGKELVAIKTRLSLIEKRLSSLENKVGSLENKVGSLDKRVSGLEKDMKKVLKCVATENANFKIKYKRQTSGGSSQVVPIAAKSH